MTPARDMLLGLMLGCVLAGCERTPPAPTTEAVQTRPVTTAAAARFTPWVLQPPVVAAERDRSCPRILSSAPRVTEICCALGLRECLIGRTRFCDYPPGITSVPSIGGLNDVNSEALLTLQPELVLVSGASRHITQRLEQLGLHHVTLPDVALADLFTSIERVGALVQRPATAERLAAGIRDELAQVTQRYANTPPARVLLAISPLPDPPTQAFVAGPGSYLDDLLRRGGHVNAAAGLQRSFAPLSLEVIVEADPDVIIELATDAAHRPGGDLEAQRVWAKVGVLRAVNNRRVHVLRGEQHGILGPRIAQTFDAICATIAGRNHD